MVGNIWGTNYLFNKKIGKHEKHVFHYFLFIMILWYQYDSAISIWFCDINMILWYQYDSLISIWFCDINIILWYQYHSVISIWFCDINIILWYQYHSVISISFCDINIVFLPMGFAAFYLRRLTPPRTPLFFFMFKTELVKQLFFEVRMRPRTIARSIELEMLIRMH